MNDQSAETDAGVVKTDSSGRPCRSLRVWPAVLLAGLMLAARFGPRLLEGGASTYWMVAVFGPMLCCLLILIWWLTTSRATWKERLTAEHRAKDRYHPVGDRKSTRLNSSHLGISYAVFCL